jgi:hypothetical protein
MKTSRVMLRSASACLPAACVGDAPRQQNHPLRAIRSIIPLPPFCVPSPMSRAARDAQRRHVREPDALPSGGRFTRQGRPIRGLSTIVGERCEGRGAHIPIPEDI